MALPRPFRARFTAPAPRGDGGRDPLRSWRTMLGGFGAVWAVAAGLGYARDPAQPVAAHVLGAGALAASMTLTAAFAFAVVRRHPDAWRDGRRSLRLLATLLACGTALVAALAALVLAVEPLDEPPPAGFLKRPTYGVLVLASLPEFLTVFLGFAGVAYAADYLRRGRRAELLHARLGTELARTRLQLLRSQLHPHFLFNTLHSISALMYDDPAGADRMLARLAELLRAALSDAEVQMVPLREELAFLDAYLQIERARLGGRLRVEVDADPALAAFPVPRLLLQPLVENAIRHGIAPRRAGGTVRITARGDAAGAVLEVRDDGPGLPAAWTPRPGAVGVANTRARVEHLYGGGGAFDLENAEGGGVVARVRLPPRPVAA